MFVVSDIYITLPINLFCHITNKISDKIMIVSDSM